MESCILEKKLLQVEKFQLKKNYHALFYSVLCSIINIYNEVPKKESEKKGIYFLEEEKVLLANITKDLVESYYEYEKLFQNLMGGKNTLFQKFSPEFDKMSNGSWQNNKNHKYNIALSNSSNNTSNNNEVNNNDNKTTTSLLEKKHKCYITENLNNKKESKIKNNLEEFSNYYNGIYFESMAIESLLRLIDENFSDEEDSKNSVIFLPRIIFYLEKKIKYQVYKADETKYYGYNEIDCAFILKNKETVVFKREMITFFKSFDAIEESEFFGINNFCELTLFKDDIVLIEVKSSWNELSKKEENKKDNGNKLEKFISRAKKFVYFYLKLELIKKTQRVVLIYLYNNSMYFNIEKENQEIKKAYELLKDEKNMELYIAYYQPYVKMFNSFQNIKQFRKLNQRLETQENEIEKLKQEMKEMRDLLNKMNLHQPNMNNNLENNVEEIIDKDNNDKKKKSSTSSGSNTTTNDSFNKK